MAFPVIEQEIMILMETSLFIEKNKIIWVEHVPEFNLTEGNFEDLL